MCSWSITFWESNTEECCKHLKNSTVWESIPMLNIASSHELLDGQLVRFRGMIQDMYDPEFYLSQYEVVCKTNESSSVRSGKYRDSIDWEPNEEFIQDSSHNVHSERYTFYCVPVPGINTWASSNQSSNSERRLSEPDAKGTEVHTDECIELSDSKRLRLDSNSGKTTFGKRSGLNVPLSGKEGTSCLVKMYDAEKFSLNDVIEVVGFLSINPSCAESSLPQCNEISEIVDECIVDQDVLNSGIPRLHCIAVKKLTHCNPLLPAVVSEQDAVFESADSIRQELHMVLSHLLLGDTLAADYLLCHLLSSVYLRNNSMALGKMSMNIINVPTDCDYVNKLYSVLTMLVPKSHFVPMTLNNLNKQAFIPRKDYTENKLVTGVLQLSNHTHLVLDETQLMPGQLNTCGVQNVTALGMVMRHQKLDYDFKYYTLEFDTDIPVLVLSEGKSLLPSDIVIPLHADSTHIAETFEAAKHYLKEPLLGKMRVYLTSMMHANFTVPSAMQEVIEQDFVEMRKEDSKFTPDDLHRLLVLARLVSLSKGLRELNAASWKYTIEMEHQRQHR